VFAAALCSNSSICSLSVVRFTPFWSDSGIALMRSRANTADEKMLVTPTTRPASSAMVV